jgi:hypothetical protein
MLNKEQGTENYIVNHLSLSVKLKTLKKANKTKWQSSSGVEAKGSGRVLVILSLRVVKSNIHIQKNNN